jgi:hypothetical protein
VIRADDWSELVAQTREVVLEVLRGCARISRDKGARSIDHQSVLLYIDVLKLDRLTSFKPELPAPLGRLTPFLAQDYENLRSILTGPSERRFAPLPETVWKAVWQDRHSTPVEPSADESALREISGIANRGLLELFASAYLSAWVSLSSGLRQFEDFGIRIEQRPQKFLIDKRHISASCQDLPFPLNQLK